MAGRVELDDLVRRVFDREPALAALQPVVVKELMHYEIMQALGEAGYLNALTFHGGTALRLCYGASRLSEDLDFAGGPGFTRSDVDGMSEAVQGYLTDRYGLNVEVREPRPRVEDGRSVGVDTWQISVITDPGRSHLPRQRIHIDIATMAARSRDVKAIRQNYAVLPTGLGEMLVPAMTRDEIMANKLVSLPASTHQRNIRHRDIWDIAWLAQNGAKVNRDWVAARAAEFELDDYVVRIDAMREALPDHVGGTRFREQMSRFLPRDVIARTLDRPEFIPYVVGVIDEHLAQAREAFARPAPKAWNSSGMTM